jgi:endonuclease/exonuclease/phosphatase family metal-dependent hydrolase
MERNRQALVAGVCTDRVADFGGRHLSFLARISRFLALRGAALVVVAVAGGVQPVLAQATYTPQGDVTLWAGQAPTRAGKWVIQSDASAAGGRLIRHPDAGAAKITTALASPANYFEMTFQAQAGVPYSLWLHGRADSNYWPNDSVFVQFSGSVASSGSSTFRIGTTSATEVNLEDCSGCGLSGWVWQDNGYGLGVPGTPIYFAASGTQKIRVQTREDGLAIDMIALTVAAGSTTTTSETTTTSGSGGSAEIRVLQWNLHHGVGTDGNYDIDRIATWMARMNPDIIMLNEVEKNTYWGNEDQPARYKAMIQSKTGRTWYSAFAQEFGSWDSSGKGHLILSTFPIESIDRVLISYDRVISDAHIVVNGRTLSLLVTHLDPYSQSIRLTQAREVISWAAAHPENRILTGDMNAWPDQSSIAELNTEYNDSWTVATSKGAAYQFSSLSPDGATKNGRIDYIFLSKNAANLAVLSSQVYDTRDGSGQMPSDHRPVLTTIEVR